MSDAEPGDVTSPAATAPRRGRDRLAAPAPGAPPGLVLRILASSRFFVAIAVLGTFLASVTLLVYGTLGVIDVAWDTVAHGELSPAGAKHLSVALVELTDVFLLGTVLYIVALGLYELFIDDMLPVPPWLRVRDLDDLKGKLIGVIIVLLGVTFLGQVVDWNGETGILDLGAAIALVIAALSALLFVTARSHEEGTGATEDESG